MVYVCAYTVPVRARAAIVNQHFAIAVSQCFILRSPFFWIIVVHGRLAEAGGMECQHPASAT